MDSGSQRGTYGKLTKFTHMSHRSTCQTRIANSHDIYDKLVWNSHAKYRIPYSKQLNYREIGVAPAIFARIAEALE